MDRYTKFTLEHSFFGRFYTMLLIVAGWLVLVRLVGPIVVDSAYHGHSLPALNAQIADQASRPVEDYLRKWQAMSWQVLPILLLFGLMVSSPRDDQRILLLAALLLVSAQVRLPGLFSRAIWDDEAITLLETSGHAMPAWPREPAAAQTAQGFYRGAASVRTITEELRRTDVHPPVYFWALSFWRQWFGFSIETARGLSVVCSVGAILAFYALLHVSRYEFPLIPTLIYAMSTSAVFWGSEARPYALASLLISMATLFAYLACDTSRKPTHAVLYAVAMAICCGVAFQTNYLTVFPTGVILLWFGVNQCRSRRALAVIAPMIAASIGMIGVSALFSQLGARPAQGVGFSGWVSEAKYMLSINFNLLFNPYVPRTGAVYPYAVAAAIAVAGLLMYMLRHWPQRDRNLWMLFLGLAAGPSIGLVVLNVVFNKHLHYYQYVLYGAPALATFVSYPIVRTWTVNRPAAACLLGAVLVVQIAGTNWGFEEGPIEEGVSRSTARAIKASASSSQLVLIDEGLGRANPSSLVYELDPQTTVLVFGKNSDLKRLLATISRYDDVWMRFSTDYPPNDIRDQFLDALESAGCYEQVSYRWFLLRLRKATPCKPGSQWPSRQALSHDFSLSSL